MMPCTNGNAFSVQHGCNIMGMNVFQIKCHQSHAILLRTVYRYAFNFSNSFQGILRQLSVMRCNMVHADVAQEIDRGAKPYRTSNKRRAALESPGHILPRGVMPVDMIDHFAAEFDRLHRFQQRFLSVECPDAGRTTHLMAGKSEEIAIKLLHINLHMRSALRAVDDHYRTVTMSNFRNLLNRIDDP